MTIKTSKHFLLYTKFNLEMRKINETFGTGKNYKENIPSNG